MNIGFQEGYGEAYMDWLHYGKFRDLKNLRPRSRKHKYPPLSNIPSRKHCEVLDKE